MPITSLHRFHHGILPQNATAFPEAHYQALHNHDCVRMSACPPPQAKPALAKRPTAPRPALATPPTPITSNLTNPTPTQPATDKAPSRPTPANRATRPMRLQPPRPAATTSRPDPTAPPARPQMTSAPGQRADTRNAKNEANPISAATQDISAATNGSKNNSRGTGKQDTGKQRVWQPGHGVIEKVDKLTGEIVHLAESCISSNKPSKIYTA